MRSSIYTGKGSFLLLVVESRLQNVAVSSLGLETTGIHRLKKKNSCHRYSLELLRVLSCQTTVIEQLFRFENEWIIHILCRFFF